MSQCRGPKKKQASALSVLNFRTKIGDRFSFARGEPLSSLLEGREREREGERERGREREGERERERERGRERERESQNSGFSVTNQYCGKENIAHKFGALQNRQFLPFLSSNH